MTWLAADAAALIVIGAFPIAACLWTRLGLAWAPAIAATAGIYAVAAIAAGGLFFFI